MRRSDILLAPAWVATALLAATPGAAQIQKVETKPAPKGTTVVKEQVITTRVVTVPAAPAVWGVAGVPGQAAKEAMAAQFLPQIRPILRAELHLIRTVCKTSEEEQLALAREGEKALQLAVDKVAELQVQAQKGNVVVMPDVPNRVQTALAAAVKAKLSPERAERYRAEIDERARVRREVAARNLVAKLDRLLNLSPDQRAKIAAALEESADSLASTVDNLIIMDTEYYPNLPAPQVVPFLDETQKAIWGSTQKVSFGSSNFGVVGLNLAEDDLAEEDDPAVAKEAARTKRAAGVRQFINNLMRNVPAAKAFLPQAPAPVLVAPRDLMMIEVAPAAPAVTIPAPPPAPRVRPSAK